MKNEKIKIDEIRYENHVFELLVPIEVEVEPSSEGWILYYEDLYILIFAKTIEKCIEEFHEYFGVLWEEYVKEIDEKLTEDACEFKRKLLKMVRMVQ